MRCSQDPWSLLSAHPSKQAGHLLQPSIEAGINLNAIISIANLSVSVISSPLIHPHKGQALFDSLGPLNTLLIDTRSLGRIIVVIIFISFYIFMPLLSITIKTSLETLFAPSTLALSQAL